MYAHLWQLTHWGRYEMAAISQTTFSSAFPWIKTFEFQMKFHRNFFLRVLLTIWYHSFRKWLGAKQAANHYLDPCRFGSLTHISASIGLDELTHLAMMLKYCRINWPMLWLLIPLLLAWPGHQHPVNRLCKMIGSLSIARKNASCVPSQTWKMMWNTKIFVCFLK